MTATQMTAKQAEIIKELKVAAQIDPATEINDRVSFLTEYALAIPGCNGFVLGISGGQDSTLAGKLAQLAAVKLREHRPNAKFVAVRLPYSKQFDAEDAAAAIQFIAPDESHSVQIENSVDELVAGIEKTGTNSKVSDFNKGNIKARIRMVVQYALAGDQNLLVVGSDHAAEAVTGFYTKFGDGAADVMPLSGLTKRQGAKLLEYLGAPDSLWKKIPTADLLDGKPGESDEAALGVSYEEIDDYLEGKSVSQAAAANIENKFLISKHKREKPVTPKDEWWKNG